MTIKTTAILALAMGLSLPGTVFAQEVSKGTGGGFASVTAGANGVWFSDNESNFSFGGFSVSVSNGRGGSITGGEGDVSAIGGGGPAGGVAGIGGGGPAGGVGGIGSGPEGGVGGIGM